MNPIASRPSIAFSDSRSRNPVHPVRVNGPANACILGGVLAAAVLAAAKDGDLLQTIFGRGAEGRPDIRRNYYVPATAVQQTTPVRQSQQRWRRL